MSHAPQVQPMYHQQPMQMQQQHHQQPMQQQMHMQPQQQMMQSQPMYAQQQQQQMYMQQQPQQQQMMQPQPMYAQQQPMYAQPQQQQMHPQQQMMHSPPSQSMSPQPGGSNALLQTLGPRYAIVPNISVDENAKCSPCPCYVPNIVKKMHIVPTQGIFDPPTAREVSSQVTANQSRFPAPFSSVVDHPEACCWKTSCCHEDCTRGLLSNQTFSDAKGTEQFSIKTIFRCCNLCHDIKSFGPADREIGTVRVNSPSCCMLCNIFCCSICCRSASLPEWAWMSALDASDQERLTFRHPATQGECLLCKNCCKCNCDACNAACNACMALPCFALCCSGPDIPFMKSMLLFGPLDKSGDVSAPLGTVEVRGAYGFDRRCICPELGIRPQMTIEYRMNQPIGFDDSVLAAQMGLTIASGATWYRGQGAYTRKLWFGKPSTVRMV